ncbi:MAG: hypothetical protein AVDCRST_MAG12-2310 [uncultured Rubrobacteraceae bacterium]|uniref:CARDB domain-containing protein n=1 Tax=uncultured Rubrobacteraceae bacterium TaxID=349277 RepID=A0A6J4SJD2_9ACTN|nr:MAG: hypothetical protein AVDCRST_MAG12-2310 [uncultured Rubrobacteraceae bacterium]
MRGAALWAAGAALAFFLTAGAFLFLANLATGPAAEDLPATPARGKPGPALDLDLNRDRLSSLEPAPDQELLLTVENAGGKDFSNVNLTLEASSEDTANPRSRYYRRTLRDLKAGDRIEVSFLLDLSKPPEGSASPTATDEQSEILEIRATTPEDVSEVRTAILPL